MQLKMAPVYKHLNRSKGCMGNFIFKSKYTLLIANSWSKTKDEVKSAAIWRCTKKESCQFKEKHNNESKHFCTCNPNNVKTSLCIGIKCKNIVRKNKARATKCKYTMEHNAQSPTDCENFTSIQTLGKAEIASQGGKVPCKNVCSFSVIKSGVHAIRSSGVEKFLKVVISKFDDLEAYGNMTNFFDIIDKCSDDTKCQVFVNRHKSSIFLCVFSTTTDSICVTLKCREVHDTSTDTNNMDTNAENWRTLQTAWKNWKKEIVLVSAGVVLLSGISGFLFGVCFSVFRKSRPIKRYLERKHVYTVNSELYEQISDTSSIIQERCIHATVYQHSLREGNEHVFYGRQILYQDKQNTHL
ncbi:uncharacterized protein LOC134268781 [Saccostrea cucullata]|uniref:uncharacterized protein LOC134268781 n=1 Tax=Saccostrea cuccullata TaxID=36930 RepID=UPI002ED3A2EB